MTQAKNEQLMTRRLIEQVFTNWVNPELEKRRNEGKLPSDFNLKVAQVIFSVGGLPVVRVNNEVKVIVEARFNRPVNKGEAIFDRDIEDIRSFKLIEKERDFGYITVIKLTKGWFVGFSFIYDVSKSKARYEIAQEFIKSAHHSLSNKLYRPFVESAFIAAENLAKARLFLLPDQDIRKKRVKHSVTKRKVEMFSKTGSIIKPEHSDLFVELLRLRDQARYDPGFKLKRLDASKLFDLLKDLNKEVFLLLVRYGGISN